MLTSPRDRSVLHRRQCVACGYSGRFVERPGQTHCPKCACDFAERPPRSYAEMEGLDLEQPSVARAARRHAFEPVAGEWRLVERWLVFLFAAMVVGLAVLALGVAALAVR